MSGRELLLTGFASREVHCFYSIESTAYSNQNVSTSLLNRFLHIASQFRVDRIEIFNALGLFSTFLNRSVPKSIIFLATLRLSVFWRRRRDIMVHNNSFVLECFEKLAVPPTIIQEVECEVLSGLGCHIWDSRRNLAEAVYCVLDSMKTCAKIDVLKDLAIDFGYLTYMSEIEMLGEEIPSFWYDLLNNILS